MPPLGRLILLGGVWVTVQGGAQGVVPVAVEDVPGQGQCSQIGVTDTSAKRMSAGVERGLHPCERTRVPPGRWPRRSRSMATRPPGGRTLRVPLDGHLSVHIVIFGRLRAETVTIADFGDLPTGWGDRSRKTLLRRASRHRAPSSAPPGGARGPRHRWLCLAAAPHLSPVELSVYLEISWPPSRSHTAIYQE